jgi:hypothetical protein
MSINTRGERKKRKSLDLLVNDDITSQSSHEVEEKEKIVPVKKKRGNLICLFIS